MAIYHLSHGMVSRSTGRSSVQSAAYITGEKLHESRRDLEVNYQNRHSDIAFTATLAPEHAPDNFKDIGVWDLLETFEDEYGNKRYKTDETRAAYLNSAQTAQTIIVALPRELDVKVAKELVEEFAINRFVSRDLIVTYAIHDDEGNPHVHLQISRRSVNENGEISWAKDRAICSLKEVRVTRKLWADLTNQYLEREGHETRITEKSFADLGIQLEPTQHRGWVADKLDAMGIKSRIVVENAEAFETNRETLLENPATILPELTQNNATFTQMNLLRAISKRVGDDAPLVAQVFEAALQASIVVGKGIDNHIRYTSPTYKALEENAVGMVSELSATPFEQPHLTKNSTEAYLLTHFAHLSPEQQAAVTGLTQEQSLAVLVGRAGSGKTTTLKAVSDIYKDAGHPVIGASLSAMAADNLGREAGIQAATLHSWIYQWERYQAAQEKFLSFDSVMEEGVFKQLDWYQDLKRFEKTVLTKDTVLIVDESGMVGTRLWGELLTHVNRAGAKLIAVGDDNQFKAIEAGDFFREIQTHAQNYSLNTIYRQKQEWMKDASMNLANLEVGEALSAYEQRGHVHQTLKANLAHEIAAAYVAAHKKEQNEQTSVVLAFTNAQTHEINQAIREQLKQEGLIAKQDVITMNDNLFAIGDRIVFLENDKTRLVITDADGVVQKEIHIKNGTQGMIQGVNQQGDIQIQLGDKLMTTIICLEGTVDLIFSYDRMKGRIKNQFAMQLDQKLKRHRFPVSIISQAVWLYHRFNHSYRDVQEQLAFCGILLHHETVRDWCRKFANHFRDVIKKRERKPSDTWHLDEMTVKINGEPFILWRAVDSEGIELDVFLQKRRNKKAAIRFLSRLLSSYPSPRVIVTDKLKSYNKPIKYMCAKAEHRCHKRLNNRVENAHQPTRRKEKYLIKFKSAQGTQRLLSLMGKVRNIFAVDVGRYTKKGSEQRLAFVAAQTIWLEAAQGLFSI